jgi:hypothetical protein
MNIDLEELISFLARRGEIELLQVLKHIQEEYERSIDPDYDSESDYDIESESEVSMSDIVEEELEINPSMNGFISLK